MKPKYKIIRDLIYTFSEKNICLKFRILSFILFSPIYKIL